MGIYVMTVGDSGDVCCLDEGGSTPSAISMVSSYKRRLANKRTDNIRIHALATSPCAPRNVTSTSGKSPLGLNFSNFRKYLHTSFEYWQNKSIVAPYGWNSLYDHPNAPG